jgi:hypothetical protein
VTKRVFTGSVFLALLCLSIEMTGQTPGQIIHENSECNCHEVEKGLYRKFSELRDNSPFQVSHFTAALSHSNKSKTQPRAYYEITVTDSASTITDPEKQLYALSDGEYLYINTISAGRKKGFVRACCFGGFAFFHEINPNYDYYYNPAGSVGLAGAAFSGAVSSYASSTDKGNMPRQVIFILDFETGLVSPLNSFKMEKILENQPEQLKEYMAEPRRTNMEVMHYYLDRYITGKSH